MQYDKKHTSELLKQDLQDPSIAQQVTEDLGVIRTHVKMDAAFISEFKNGRRVFRYINSDSQIANIQALDGDPLEESLCQLIVEEKIPGFIQDIEKLEVTKSVKSASRLNIRSYLGVPIRLANGDLYGTFCCFSHSPRWDLNAQDVETMNMFAAITAKRLEKELQQHKDNAEIENRVQKMLDSNDLTMVYQPIYDIENHQINGYEALSRFHNIPGLTPDVWFDDAAKVNLTIDLEIKAIKLALKELMSLPCNIYLSINSSAETILSSQFSAALEGLSLEKIVLEITEHQSIEQYESINEALKPLRKNGLKLAVDDAGAGFASFRHILALEPEYIKIDISIIRNIHLDPAKQSLTKAFIAFAEQTDSKIVAEGVEVLEELLTLRALGIKNAQGYYLGKPELLKST